MTIDELREFCRGELVYLAHPFSAPTEAARERNRSTAQACHDVLALHGIYVFNPLPGSKDSRVKDEEYWYELDLRVLSHCDVLVVAQAPGWDASLGVLREVERASQLGKPVVLWSEGFKLATRDETRDITKALVVMRKEVRRSAQGDRA